MRYPAQKLPKQSHPDSKQAFALIISLSLMAFVLLLVLSLSTLIQVEIKSANNQEQHAFAQQNALLALQIAIGELQKNAGPDQRITSTASYLDSDPATTVIDDVDEPNWTGVWDADGNLLTWLVSGNSGRLPADTGFVGPATRPQDTQAIYNDDSGREVQVPLAAIDTEGAYAYWISDEGVKAKITLADSTKLAEALTSAQKVDITRMSDLQWLSNVSNQQTVRERLNSIEGLKLLASGNDEASTIDLLGQDLTAHSYGLLTDTATGGLKQDLTLALYDSNDLPSGQIFPAQSGSSSLLDPGGPTWQQLQTWVEIPTTGDLSTRPQHDNQTGISPVITQFQFFVVPRTQIDTVANKQDIYLDIYPAITLWNPYDRPLVIEDGRLDVARRFWDFSQWAPSGGTFRWHYLPFHAWKLYVTQNSDWNAKSEYYHDTSPMFPSLQVLSTGVHDGMLFSLGQVTLQPGESVTFSPPAKADLADADRLMSMNKTDVYPLTPGFHPDGNYYLLTDISGADALDYDPASPLQFILRASVNSNLALSLRDGDKLLQELHHFGASQDSTYQWNEFLPLNQLSNDMMKGSVGIKAIRNFTTWDVLDGNKEDRAIQWLSHSNPRGSYQGANPLFFHDEIANINARATNNPSISASTVFDNVVGGWQLGLNNVGNGWSVDSSDLDTTVLYKSSLSRSDLHSIGQLMHAPLFYTGANRSNGLYTNLEDAEEDASDITRYGRFDNLIPAYAIGNSEADPSIPLDSLAVRWQASDYTDDTVYDYLRIEGSHYDYSYLLNEALWDGYFFSTLASDVSREPANPRLVPLDATQTTPLSSQTLASEFMVDGAFNINSTSEEAWRALLGAFFGEAQLNAESASPFVRVLDNNSLLFDPDDPDDVEDNEAYHGYRALTQDQIINLAHQIVKQIKWYRSELAQPFTSLAKFINRDPDHNAPSAMGNLNAFRLKGALARALQQADLITETEANDLGIDADAAKINTALQESSIATDTSDVMPGFVTEAMEGWRSEGLPAWLTQADLLARLGAVLTARSDTFKIRVYGESRDPINGEINGKALGEATLQRIPDYVASTADDASVDTDSLSSQDNITFGRRFIVTNFHWVDIH